MNSYGRGEDNRKKSGSSVVTRETFGMTLLFFSVILLLFAMIGPLVLGEIGVAISAFLLGTLGFFIYPFLLVTVYASIVLISGKNFLSGGLILRAMLVTIGAFLIAHLATGNKFFGSGFGSYMSGCWNAASVSAKDATAGGVVFGIVVYPFRALLTLPGAYIALSLLEVAALGFVLYQPIKQRMYRGQATGGAAVTDQGKRFDDLPEGKQGRLTVKEALGAVNDMKGIPDRVQKDEKPPVMPQKTQPAPVQQSYQGAEQRTVSKRTISKRTVRAKSSKFLAAALSRATLSRSAHAAARAEQSKQTVSKRTISKRAVRARAAVRHVGRPHPAAHTARPLAAALSRTIFTARAEQRAVSKRNSKRTIRAAFAGPRGAEAEGDDERGALRPLRVEARGAEGDGCAHVLIHARSFK